MASASDDAALRAWASATSCSPASMAASTTRRTSTAEAHRRSTASNTRATPAGVSSWVGKAAMAVRRASLSVVNGCRTCRVVPMVASRIGRPSGTSASVADSDARTLGMASAESESPSTTIASRLGTGAASSTASSAAGRDAASGGVSDEAETAADTVSSLSPMRRSSCTGCRLPSSLTSTSSGRRSVRKRPWRSTATRSITTSSDATRNEGSGCCACPSAVTHVTSASTTAIECAGRDIRGRLSALQLPAFGSATTRRSRTCHFTTQCVARGSQAARAAAGMRPSPR